MPKTWTQFASKDGEMPKIKVYKGRGAIIPVDDAKVATGFKCPWTGKIFSTKKSYVAHLRVLREDRIHRAIRARIRNKVFESLINQPSFEKIIEWIETHPEFVFDGVVRDGRDGWGKSKGHLRNQFWVKITYLDVHWSDTVNNSHSCPRGEVTNFDGRKIMPDGSSAPRGYPGWSGRIEFQLSHDLGFGSDIMKSLGINTGSGGSSGNHRYGYDVKLFASDWPGLAKNSVFEIIKGNKPVGHRCGDPRYFRH